MLKIKDLLKPLDGNKYVITFDDVITKDSKVAFVGWACDTPKHYYNLDVHGLTTNNDLVNVCVRVCDIDNCFYALDVIGGLNNDK